MQPDECLPDLPLRGGGEQQEHEESDPGFQPVSEPHTGWKPVPLCEDRESEKGAGFHNSPDETPPPPVTYPRGAEPEGSAGASTSELRRVIWEMLMKSIFPLSCWT